MLFPGNSVFFIYRCIPDWVREIPGTGVGLCKELLNLSAAPNGSGVIDRVWVRGEWTAIIADYIMQSKAAGVDDRHRR